MCSQETRRWRWEQEAGIRQPSLPIWAQEFTPLNAMPCSPNRQRERLARLGYDGVEVIAGDGSEGYPPAAPYAIILVTAAAPLIPPALLDQLAEEGRLVIPVGDLRHQDLLLNLKQAGQVKTRMLDPCQFVPLIGKGGWPEKEGRLM